MAYETGPSENTLTVNNTHQMLAYFEDPRSAHFDHLVAFSPSRFWENLRGYDIRLPTLKTTVYQYKRPKIPESGSITNTWRRFSIDADQWDTLTDLFEPGQAFFALPITLAEHRLDECLDRTAFVDVHGILPNTSLVYVPPDAVSDGTVTDFLLAKIKNDRKYPIIPSYVYGWRDLGRSIDDCSLGLRVGSFSEHSPSFQTFTERIEYLQELDEEWMEERKRLIVQDQESTYFEFFDTVARLDQQNPPGYFYNLEPDDSATWGEVEDLMPSDPAGVRPLLRDFIDREWASSRIAERIEGSRETDRDVSTYRIKRSQVNVFGR